MIKVGLKLELSTSPLLYRLLVKHPDVEVAWIQKNELGDPEELFFRSIEGEIGDAKVLDAAEVPDFAAIDLYIGPPSRELAEYLSKGGELKTILPFGYDVVGVCELNRKAIVRGATEVYRPDAITLLGSLALMPLARNLMLNSPVVGTAMVPGDDCAVEGFYTDDQLEVLREKVLMELQKSFNSPLVIRRMTVAESDFACAVFTVGLRMAAQEVMKLYHESYDYHRHILLTDSPISRAMVLGTNKTAIAVANDPLGNLAVSVGFDPRYKAGAGNIIHILNLLFGLDERTGL